MTVQLIDPTVSPSPHRYTLARRQSLIKQPIIGLVGNGKPNAGKVLGGVADRVERQLGLKLERLILKKPHASRVMPVAMVDRIAQRCHFALVGVGD